MSLSKPILLSLICLITIFGQFNKPATAQHNKTKATQWLPVEILKSKDSKIEKIGTPEVIQSPYGKALQFNGIDEGLILDEMPLEGLSKFTVEVIFYPQSGGKFEQRFLHVGEVNGSRILLELRANEKDWYFDAFLKSEDQAKALIDSTLLHPLDQWYHVAFVVDNGEISSYVNSKKELESKIEMQPIETGGSSIGVRLNKRSWFKGAIYKIRISPTILTPDAFMKH